MSVVDNPLALEKRLKQFFGFPTIRSAAQIVATQQILRGDGDVYVNLEPGAGKSLCFQLPTLLKPHKVTIVFVTTPFVATNQISFLQRNRIEAQFISPHRCDRQSSDLKHYQGEENKIDTQFIYVLVHPRCVNLIYYFIVELNKKNALSYVVFDEAHSISPLSDDYLPAYQALADLVNKYCPDVCKIALTATATAEVRRDLLAKLDMKNQHRFRPSKYRSTAYHDVHFVEILPDRVKHLIEFIRKALNLSEHQQLSQETRNSGIIFCRKKKGTESLQKKLVSAGIRAVAINGDMPLSKQMLNFKKWESGQISVLVTTHKFAIGLHKPNVRFVVHWNLPYSLEQLHQENGRISKDGESCYCRIYYSCKEEIKIKSSVKTPPPSKLTKPYDVVERRLKCLDDVLSYCLQKTCRHVAASQTFFHIAIENCGKFCDACQDPKNLKERIAKFLEHRASMKIADYPDLKDAADVVKVIGKKQVIQFSKSDPDKRGVFRKLLYLELMRNYNTIVEKIEKNVKEFQVTGIACRLEDYLFTSAHSPKHYERAVVKAELHIKRCTASNTICGYLKYYEAREKPIFYSKPIVMDLTEVEDDDVPAKRKRVDKSVIVDDPVATMTKDAELITISSDSSGSETP